MNTVVQSKNLRFTYTLDTQLVYPDFSLKSGQELLILGKSGVGKTTLLHLLAMLLRPDRGQIEINGVDICQMKNNEAGKFRAKNIGLVFQQQHFIRSASVADNLLAANYFSGRVANKSRMNRLAKNLGIAEFLSHKTFQLSGGELQRVGIARALMNAPVLVLADEPTANLDDENCTKVHTLLAENCKENNAALIVVTHDWRLKRLVDNHLSL